MSCPLYLVCSLPLILSLSAAKVFLREQFNDAAWRDRWTVPTKWKPESELGEWGWTIGKWHGGDETNKGIQTSQEARFYGIIAPLDEPLTQTGDMVIQFTVKHENRVRVSFACW